MTAALNFNQEQALVLKARKTLRTALSDHALLADNAPFGTLAAPQHFNGQNFADFLDLTNLKPQATSADIAALCDKAKAMGAATVCVNPSRIGLAAECLKGTATKAICVVGFPLGSTFPEAIAFETTKAIAAGAAEIDMVQNVGLLLDGDYLGVYHQVKAVVAAAGKVPVKVILEACKLSDEEVVVSSLIAACAGAAFVKTSTGFATDKRDDQPHIGATVGRIRLMRLAVGDGLGVKASGGIKTTADATALLQNGADRLGASGLDTGGSY